MGETMRGRRGDPLGDVLTAVRWLFVAAGAVATLPVVASLVLRQVDVSTPRLVAYVAGTPVVLVAGLGATACFLLGGSRVGTAVAGVLTSLLALTQVPLYLGTSAPADGSTTVTVMTVNLHYGNGDADQIVAAVRAHDVDVLATEELTNPAVDALRDAGIDDVLPFAALKPGGDRGNGVWSRHPVVELATPDDFVNEPVAVRMEVAGQDLFVAAVHPTSPYPDGADEWSREMGLLADWLHEIDDRAIVAGDFNATLDHRQFRDVLAAGFADAAAQVGAGWLPTYPANRRRLPLLITIDHVLASDGIVATHVTRVDIADTDHAALVARLAVPPG